MHLTELHKLAKIDVVSAYTVAGTSDVVTSAIDMQGYDCLMLICANLAVANAGNYMTAAQCATTGGSYVDLAGSKVLTDSTNDAMILNIVKPTKRFIKATIKRGSSSANAEVIAIKYNSRVQPQDNVVANSVKVVGLIEPAEGTA